VSGDGNVSDDVGAGTPLGGLGEAPWRDLKGKVLGLWLPKVSRPGSLSSRIDHFSIVEECNCSSNPGRTYASSKLSPTMRS
jgi:hypothetical protein